tara:strand:+ start:3266 stop:3865 length:600 start_codon:yes stop_codon:yes gene_type:complete
MKLSIFAAAIGFAAFAPALMTAPSAQAQSAVAKCAANVGNTAKVLRVSPKFATSQNIGRTCSMNSARPALSTAEFLRRYVVAAKIGQKVAPPQVMKACPAMARKAVVTAGANPKAASADNMKKACAAGKGRPVIATAGFLSSMTAGVRCMDRTMKSFRALQIDPKVGSQKNAQTACKNARNRPAIAVRNFLARLTKNAK